MLLYDFSQRELIEEKCFPKSWVKNRSFFALCRVGDIEDLQHIFHFDESTVLECADVDESVRFESFEGYDFISLVHAGLSGDELLFQEINLYVSGGYIIAVMPDNPEGRLKNLENRVLQAVTGLSEGGECSVRALYAIFHILISDFSDMLESLEDDLVALQEEIITHVDKKQFERINRYRNVLYSTKKLLRATSYIGAQILINTNALLTKDTRRFFTNIDTRLKKLYDFSESLYELCNQLLYTYDSRLSMKTNEAVNKLTIVTVFFGPLTVITGIYGMNFEFMPELSSPFGYPGVLILMGIVSGLIYWWLKRKTWL